MQLHRGKTSTIFKGSAWTLKSVYCSPKTVTIGWDYSIPRAAVLPLVLPFNNVSIRRLMAYVSALHR